MVDEKSMPLVSVLMGVYNGAALLPGCVDSLLGQTYRNWELILCDDGSTDETHAVARQLAAAHPGRVTVLKNERNMGLAYSLNRCLAVALGELLARQDADDFSLPERFARQIAFLQTHPEYGWVSAGMTIFNERGEVGVRLGKEKPVKTDLIQCSCFAHAPTMFRAEVLRSVGGYHVAHFTFKGGEDYDLWMRLYSSGYRGYNLQESLYRVLEDRQAYRRKRSYRIRREMILRYNGYKVMKVPFWYYPYVLRPLIISLLPDNILKWIQELRWSRNAHTPG